MAFWSASVNNSCHARNAVVTAPEMQDALDDLNRTLSVTGMPEIKIGIGINTGIMTVGDMGSVVSKMFTVTVDAINLDSRLERIAKQYGVGIIVSEATCRAVDDVIFRELDQVQVKGNEQPVTIFEPVGYKGRLSEQLLTELDPWNQQL